MTERLRTSIASPIGRVWMIIADGALELLDFEDQDSDRLGALLKRHYRDGLPAEGADHSGIASSVEAYFSGELAAIDAVAVAPKGTIFQQDVWRALRTVPCGETIVYRELARRAGRPRAVRAAGAANGQNPVSIVIPCHWVIGSDGTLTGYGGGLHRKAWLLRHEGARAT